MKPLKITKKAIKASPATLASPEHELDDTVAIYRSLCFANTRCDTHPEQPSLRPLGYSIDGAAILDKTDAKGKQNLQRKGGNNPLSAATATKIHSWSFIFGF